MEWSNYFRTLERIYRIKFDSAWKSTIKHHFTEDNHLITEQDMYEHTQRTILSYCFRKLNNEKLNK